MTTADSSSGGEKLSIPGNVYLVGMMGAGKSSIGRLLARRLRKEFRDSDHEIERRTGVKIPVIFEIEGEAGFRRREAAVIRELTTETDIVLATGGGAVLDPDTRRVLHESGTVIYLRTDPIELWNRTRHDRNRPLLRTEDPLGKLQTLSQERSPLYTDVAHIVVDSGNQTMKSLTQRIERELLQRLAATRPATTSAGA